MNIHQHHKDLLIVDKGKYAIKLLNIINDDDTFLVSYYFYDRELEVLDKWYKLIEKDYYIEKPEIYLSKFKEVQEFFPNPIDLKLLDTVNNDVKEVNKYYELKERINIIKTKYQNKRQQKTENETKNETENETLNKKEKELLEKLLKKEESKEVLRDQFYANSDNENIRVYLNYDDIKSINNNLEAFNEKGNALINKNVDYSYIDNDGIQIEQEHNKNKYYYLYTNEDNKLTSQSCDMLILYHTEEMKAAVINNYTPLEIKLAKDNMYGFQLIKIINLENNKIIIDNIINDFNEKINNKIFNSKDELEKTIDTILNVNNDKKLTEIKENERVYEYFNLYIHKDDNIEHKVKFSDISSKVQSYLNIDNNDIKFRHRLSKYLISYGFKKKRFKDGFYYYGITFKEPNTHNINITGIGGLDKLIKQRENDLQDIQLKNRNKNINFEIIRPLDEGLVRNNNLKKKLNT